LNTTTTTLLYGSAELDGKNSTDNVYLKYTDVGVTTFPFLAITSQYGIDSTFDGILGLSRQDSVYGNGPLFVEQAKLAGALTTEKVSFYMSSKTGINYADFGEYTLSSVKNSDANNIAWLNMPAEGLFWYSAAVQAVGIGSNEFTNTGRTA
jgi:hypothetical protein